MTLGDTVMKAHAQKVRTLAGGKILAGFAGAAADAFTLFDKFEEKLKRSPDNLPRAAVELAKDWRSDRVLRRLEAKQYVRHEGMAIEAISFERDKEVAWAHISGIRNNPADLPLQTARHLAGHQLGA